MAQYRLIDPAGATRNIIEWDGEADLGLQAGWTTAPFTGWSQAEMDAAVQAERARAVDAIDVATFRALHNHENRLRSIVRGVRAVVTAGQNTTLTNQGVEPSRPDMTLEQARDAFITLMP